MTSAEIATREEGVIPGSGSNALLWAGVALLRLRVRADQAAKRDPLEEPIPV